MEIAGITTEPCGCVCHKVGLFGLMCCLCTTKLLYEFVNGKDSYNQAQSPAANVESET